jgi:hypothetical protein
MVFFMAPNSKTQRAYFGMTHSIGAKFSHEQELIPVLGQRTTAQPARRNLIHEVKSLRASGFFDDLFLLRLSALSTWRLSLLAFLNGRLGAPYIGGEGY